MGNKPFTSLREDQQGPSLRQRMSRRMSRAFNINQLNNTNNNRNSRRLSISFGRRRNSVLASSSPTTTTTTTTTSQGPVVPSLDHRTIFRSQSDSAAIKNNLNHSNNSNSSPSLTLNSARQREMVPVVKLMLLGGEEGGKSTVYSQLDFIINPRYSIEDDDLLCHIWHCQIINNIVTTLANVANACFKQNMNLEKSDNELYAKLLIEATGNKGFHLNPKQFYNSLMHESVINVWSDQVIREMFEKGMLSQRMSFEETNKISIPDGIQWFLNDIQRFTPNFIPTNEDVIHCRKKTTGFWQKEWRKGSNRLKLLEVGGARSERPKYEITIEDVLGIDVLIFVISLAEYDQLCSEDFTTNRMIESLNYFGQYVNSSLFQEDIPVFLLFNKTDVFKKKLTMGITPQICFPDFDTSQEDFQGACDFIKNKFLGKVRGDMSRVTVHFISAIDIQSVSATMDAISDRLSTKL